MKKLITIAAVMMAAMFAKADIYLYWTVDLTGSEISGAQYAKLYAAGEDGKYASISSYYEIGSIYAAQSTIAVGGASASPYTNYLVELYDEALAAIAVSAEPAVYNDALAQHTWNNAVAGTQPPMSAYSFSGFVIPEPSSAMLVLLGLGALALRRRAALCRG